MPPKGFFARASARSYKIGFFLCFFHLVVSWWVIISLGLSKPTAQWQLTWVLFLPFDFPISLLWFLGLKILPDSLFGSFPYPFGEFKAFIVPAFIHGILGPLWYFFLPVAVSSFWSLRKKRYPVK
jgi:hypothetical protein